MFLTQVMIDDDLFRLLKQEKYLSARPK